MIRRVFMKAVASFFCVGLVGPEPPVFFRIRGPTIVVGPLKLYPPTLYQ